MKKFLICIMLASVVILVGCEKEVTSSTYLEGLVEYNTNLSSYYSEVELEITKNDDVITFDCEVYYLSPDYYKVVMKDNRTNNTQAIVKNDDGVFVLTPLLNKQFKFTSDWPLNSSHAYLYQSLIQNIVADDANDFIKTDNDYTITSNYSSNTNANLTKQKVTLSSDYKPLYCLVQDDSGNTLMKATYTSFVENYDLKVADFDCQTTTTTLRLEIGEGYTSVDILEVVPTYVVDGVSLAATVTNDEYVMYNYEGDYSYTVTCMYDEEDTTITDYRVYDELVLLTNGYGVMTENSITFYYGNVLVMVFSDTLDQETLISIADSF